MLLSHDLIKSKAKFQQEKASRAEFSKCLYYDIFSIPIASQGPSHKPGHYDAKYYTKIKRMSLLQGAFIYSSGRNGAMYASRTQEHFSEHSSVYQHFLFTQAQGQMGTML